MRYFGILVLISNCLPNCSVGQDADPMALVPADADIVIRLQAPDETIKDLANFANEVAPGSGGMVLGQKSALGMAIRNPGMAGIDTSQDWFAVITLNRSKNPETVLLIPATDAGAMASAVEDSGMSTYTTGSWVAYARNQSELSGLKDVAEKSSQPLAMPPQFQKAFSSRHVGVFINGETIKQEFAEEVAQLGDQWGRLVEMIVTQMQAASPTANAEPVRQMYTSVGKTVIQAIEDAETLLVTVNIDGANLEIAEILTLKSDTVSSKLLSGQPKSNFRRLDELPGGMLGYFGLSVDLKPLVAWSMNVMMMMAGDEEETSRAMSKAFERVATWEFGDVVMAGGMDSDGGLQYVQRSEVKPGQEMREAMQEYAKLGEYTVNGITQKLSYKRNVAEVAGVEVDRLTVEQTIPEELDPSGMSRRITEAMYGGKAMIQHIAVKGNVIYQSMGRDMELLSTSMAADSTPPDAYTATRNSHPKRANVIVLVDLPGTFVSMLKMVSRMPELGVPVRPEMLDSLQFAPSYIGFSAAANDNSVELLTTIPAETLRAFFMVGMRLQNGP